MQLTNAAFVLLAVHDADVGDGSAVDASISWVFSHGAATAGFGIARGVDTFEASNAGQTRAHGEVPGAGKVATTLGDSGC